MYLWMAVHVPCVPETQLPSAASSSVRWSSGCLIPIWANRSTRPPPACRSAAVTTPDEAIRHLRGSGAAFGGLVAGCSAADLQAGGGRVERFAQIGIRHPDEHRAELEAALGS